MQTISIELFILKINDEWKIMASPNSRINFKDRLEKLKMLQSKFIIEKFD